MAPATPPAGQRQFALSQLDELLNFRGHGFAPATGIHIYTELRLDNKQEASESDEKAARYLATVEEYAAVGTQAADEFGMRMLELQGTVLHFFLEGDLTESAFRRAAQFVFLFTAEMYSSLRDRLGDDWQGFASCMDHGRGIVVRHADYFADSAVTLAPAANRPAKRLLSGATPAGYVEFPQNWLPSPGGGKGWASINLRDRSTAPFLNDLEDSSLRARLRKLTAAAKSGNLADTWMRAFTEIVPGRTSPQRITGHAIRCDLDGFSSAVEDAFKRGPAAVREVAVAFEEIMRFGDDMTRTIPGAVQLPWAGDCSTILLPDLPESGVPRWLDFCIRWHSFSSGKDQTISASARRVIGTSAWAIGACRGSQGRMLSAVFPAGNRRFRIGAGWPLLTSLDAQSQGTGGDTVVHLEDYARMNTVTRRVFDKLSDTEFWIGRKLTHSRLAEVAREGGKSSPPASADFLSKVATVSVPSPRPHCSR